MPHQKLKIIHAPPFYRIHYQALESYLAHVYRLTGFNILQSIGTTHGIHPEYLIEGVIPDRLQAQADRIRTGRRADLALILTVLCTDGHIPPGQYVIDTNRPQPPLEAYKRLLRKHLNPLHRECVQFKERHRADNNFRKIARVIDHSLLEWLKSRERVEER